MPTHLDTQVTVMYGNKKRYSAKMFPAIYFYKVTRLNFEKRFVQLRSNKKAEYLSTKSINQARHGMNNMSCFLGHNLFTSII
jgi:hypothetical protein